MYTFRITSYIGTRKLVAMCIGGRMRQYEARQQQAAPPDNRVDRCSGVGAYMGISETLQGTEK